MSTAREVLLHFSHTWMTCIGLVLFLSVFLGSLLWVFRKDGRPVYARLEQLPLQEDQQ